MTRTVELRYQWVCNQTFESDGYGLFIGAAFDKGTGPGKYQNHDSLTSHKSEATVLNHLESILPRKTLKRKVNRNPSPFANSETAPPRKTTLREKESCCQ